jgi:hypothetical protein
MAMVAVSIEIEHIIVYSIISRRKSRNIATERHAHLCASRGAATSGCFFNVKLLYFFSNATVVLLLSTRR